VPAAVCGDYQTLAIVAKLNLCPVDLLSAQEALLVLEEVERGKRRLVVVAHVVQEYVLRRRRGNGNDGG